MMTFEKAAEEFRFRLLGTVVNGHVLLKHVVNKAPVARRNRFRSLQRQQRSDYSWRRVLLNLWGVRVAAAVYALDKVDNQAVFDELEKVLTLGVRVERGAA